MVSTLNLDEKFNRIRKNFCFYLDIQDHGLARSLSRRIQDMGLQQEVFLTSRVTHVVSGARCERRAGAMPPARVAQLSVQKAISLLDKLYDTFFASSRKAHVTLFTKHFIKIEFLDKLCRPIYKEFDEWPEISIEPDPPKEKKTPERITIPNQNTKETVSQKMTRKSRPRVKERSEKEAKGGYCEMCNTEYVEATLHARSARHAAFVRDHNNFLALDSLIGAAPDVAAFLSAARPLNGERRSLRSLCNGERRSPDCASGPRSPKRNGALDDERRASRRAPDEDRSYYKVVGVSTKLRSSGGFVKRKESPPACNGTEPLVVKFRKVRRSELSVLSDEAEQFMFPKRASSTSSTSSDDDEKEVKELNSRRKTTPPPVPVTNERRRQARPLALKEESSEEDSWPEDKRKRRRRAPAGVKRARRVPCKEPSAEPPTKVEVIEQVVPVEPPMELPVELPAELPVALPAEPPLVPAPEPGGSAAGGASPLRDEPAERCMKWEDGRLKYTPAVEQLEFAFESVPHSEPWYETFKRQDDDKVLTRNVPQYFALYSKSPKLPYEIGQLPPLKPNCCSLSDLGRREEKPGPSRSYGTRGMKKQKLRKRTAVVASLEAHPRKSPREHASTLAMLGAGQRRRHDDNKSTASDDTLSEPLAALASLASLASLKPDPGACEAREASERLRQFLSEVFDDAAEYEVSVESMEGEPGVVAAGAPPDVSCLVSESERCELDLPAARPRPTRAKVKKKNRTGWPTKRRSKPSPPASLHPVDRDPDVTDDDTGDTAATADDADSDTEKEDKTATETSAIDPPDRTTAEEPPESVADTTDDEDKDTETEEARERALRDSEETEARRVRRALAGLGDWLQPVVRVARVAPPASPAPPAPTRAPPARRLRSARRHNPRPHRHR